MISYTRPAPGTVVSDLGHGVTVVERDAPQTLGTVWVAPYSVNCGEHGWIESRRTVQECEHDGREHVTARHELRPAGVCDECGALVFWRGTALVDSSGKSGCRVSESGGHK